MAKHLLQKWTKVTPAVRSGPSWTRKDVKLTGNMQKKTVDCKLWNQASELEVDNGQSVVITNLLTKSWKYEITSSSTDLTNIEVSLYISP